MPETGNVVSIAGGFAWGVLISWFFVLVVLAGLVTVLVVLWLLRSDQPAEAESGGAELPRAG